MGKTGALHRFTSNQTKSDAPKSNELRDISRLMSKEFSFRGDKDVQRSLFQLLTTFPLFCILLGFMAATVQQAYWATLLLAFPTAGLLVRLFIFQHDCGHGSFFSSRFANDSLGRFISIFTMTPYDYWKRSHAAHHATSGNLDLRGKGDVPTLTVGEYLALSPLKKFGYRVFRNPVFMLGVGVPINFVLLQRLPLGGALRDAEAIKSILGLNLMMLVAFGIAMAAFGVVPVLLVYLPVIGIASAIGGWLFFIQHQYETTYWERKEAWNFHDASAFGSSFCDLPPILNWFTGNIGLHHIHHLCSRIPNHRLKECQDAFPELASFTKTLTLRESLLCWNVALWDETTSTTVSFAEVSAKQ